MNGYIPPNLIFISRPPETIENEWDDGGTINTFEAAPTFVATNEKTRETGISWAERGYGSKVKAKVAEEVNIPFSALQIVSHEKRNEGGGAFKVIADKRWYVDLRTDALLDILVNAAVKEGNVQDCQFIWARVGSHMRIVRIGSAIYDELVKSDAVKAQVVVKQGDLKPGDVLQESNGKREVFLGWVSCLVFKGCMDRGGYQTTPWTKYTLESITHLTKQGVYWKHYEWDDKEWDGKLSFAAKRDWAVDPRAKVGKRFKVGAVEVPSTWMAKVKAQTAEWFVKLTPQNEYYYNGQVERASELLTMSPVGEYPLLPAELEAYRAQYEEAKKG